MNKVYLTKNNNIPSTIEIINMTTLRKIQL